MAFFKAKTILLSLVSIIPLLIQAEIYPKNSSVFIPYVNASKNQNLDKSPTINIGFNGSGSYVPFVMDTGSVGIIASADHFKPASHAINLGPGTQYYSSSGIIEEGTWWTATQEIYDTEGKIIATANVPVLQVTSVRCAKNARFCKVRENPKGIAMMGIGFGRSQKEHGTPDYNPFLNLQTVYQNGTLKAIPANWCNGYVVTKNGVFLGLDSENTKNAALVKLLPRDKQFNQKVPDWMPASMTIQVNGVKGNGNILMDTGVGTAYLSPPQNANLESLVACSRHSRKECAPNGTRIEIYLPDNINPVAHYQFTIGNNDNAMQPRGVHIVNKQDIFLNTSRHVLAGMNFLYDNNNGYVGYIWNTNSIRSESPPLHQLLK